MIPVFVIVIACQVKLVNLVGCYYTSVDPFSSKVLCSFSIHRYLNVNKLAVLHPAEISTFWRNTSIFGRNEWKRGRRTSNCRHFGRGTPGPRCRPFFPKNFRAFLPSGRNPDRPVLLQDGGGDQRGEPQTPGRATARQERFDKHLLGLSVEPVRSRPSTMRPRLPLSRLRRSNKLDKSRPRKVPGLSKQDRKFQQRLLVLRGHRHHRHDQLNGW